MIIRGFSDFCAALTAAGFSTGGGAEKGIYAVVPFGWRDTPEGSPIKWHTGDPDTDPWEWRMRVLTERGDIAYSKLFFNAGGYITSEYYAKFYALRNGGVEFAERYEKGDASDAERRIYEAVEAIGEAPVHEIKAAASFTRDENGAFERALTSLQMKLYITICGEAQKVSNSGESYGWSSTVFCTVEDFWAARGKSEMLAAPPTKAEAEAEIRARIRELNPNADEKRIKRFMYS